MPQEYRQLTQTEDCPYYSLTCEPNYFWLYLLTVVGMIIFAGLMSGLTMGLLSLDKLNMSILQMEGSESQKSHVTKILPIVNRHHFLLVTLLLGNAMANEALPIFLSKLVPEAASVAISVTCALFFGEIVPSAIFTGKNQLHIAASLAPLVSSLMYCFYPISYPISLFLDKIFGEDHSMTRYKRNEIKALVALHQQTATTVSSDTFEVSSISSPMSCCSNSSLNLDEVTIIQGALDLATKTVKDAMTSISEVFMLEYNTILDKKVMSDILLSGHSRIPVYLGNRQCIVGVLLVKQLIVIDCDGSRSLSDINLRVPIVVPPSYSCYSILNEFQKGGSHIAIITDDAEVVMKCWQNGTKIPSTVTFQGIITIEDVLEELIQEEISDESDTNFKNSLNSCIGELQSGDTLLLGKKKQHYDRTKICISLKNNLIQPNQQYCAIETTSLLKKHEHRILIH